MIDVYTGTPGSGKSLHAASDIRFALDRRHPQPVIANFRIAEDAPVKNPGLFRYLPNEEMTAGKIIDFADEYWSNSGVEFREDHIQLVIDEAQLLFNTRRWSDRSRLSYVEFLSQSRKYGVHVLLIAQSASMIDNQFRYLIDREYNHRKVRNLGPLGYVMSAPFGGNLFVIVRTLFQERERLGMDFMIPSRKDMQMYDSYAKFERVDDLKKRLT